MTDHSEDAPNEILAAAKEAKDHAVEGFFQIVDDTKGKYC